MLSRPSGRDSMTDNYAKIVHANLDKLYDSPLAERASALSCELRGEELAFSAFGEECRIRPGGILLGDVEQTGVLGILISLYALHAQPEACVLEPLRAFKELSNSMPYVGAFATHTEQILVPHVEKVERAVEEIKDALVGKEAPAAIGGDFSFVVYPLPKTALCYVFYRADDEFPASATCLFSSNAEAFLPVDGLADVGEYTSRRILDLAT